MKSSFRQSAVIPVVCAGMAMLLATASAGAAALVQPDIRIGVSYMDNGGLTGEEEVSSAGAEVIAKLNLGWVNQRGSVTLIPMVRATAYSEENMTKREEQRLTFNWLRNFETAASNTLISFDRQDLFSSEFRDISLDPDEVPIDDDTDSGIVDRDSTRSQLRFRQDFAKGISERDDLMLGIQYRDLNYQDDGTVSRIDFNEIQAGAGWRRALSERTDVLVLGGIKRYDGDNGITADTVGAELGFDFDVSETLALSLLGGYAHTEAEDATQDFGSDGLFVFTIGAQQTGEITRYGVNLSRQVRPTSVGGLSTETGLALFLDRQLSERSQFGAGVAAFQQDRNVILGDGNDRDYLTAKLQYSWQLSRQWALEAQFRHVRQDFENSALSGGSQSRDRNRVFLNFRYRGLTEVRVPTDRRFISRGSW